MRASNFITKSMSHVQMSDLPAIYLLFTLSLLFLPLHIHLLHHNYYKCEGHVYLNLRVGILKFKMYVYGLCPKMELEILVVEHFIVHHKGLKPSLTLDRKWHWQNVWLSSFSLIVDHVDLVWYSCVNIVVIFNKRQPLNPYHHGYVPLEHTMCSIQLRWWKMRLSNAIWNDCAWTKCDCHFLLFANSVLLWLYFLVWVLWQPC